MKIESSYNLFLVAPKGEEHLASVIVAETKDSAKGKALQSPLMQHLEDDSTLVVLDLCQHFEKQGYTIAVTKSGVYH